MNPIVTAGNRGPKVRDDCLVSFDAGHKGELDIQMESRAKPLRDSDREALVRRIFQFYGIEQGHVHIDDAGALDFVLAARIEACIRQVMTGAKSFLPDMLAQNRTASSKNRLRLSRLYIPGNTPK